MLHVPAIFISYLRRMRYHGLISRKEKDMMKQEKYVAGLYCRLSRDDCQPGESVSIGTQRFVMEQKNWETV